MSLLHFLWLYWILGFRFEKNYSVRVSTTQVSRFFFYGYEIAVQAIARVQQMAAKTE